LIFTSFSFIKLISYNTNAFLYAVLAITKDKADEQTRFVLESKLQILIWDVFQLDGVYKPKQKKSAHTG